MRSVSIAFAMVLSLTVLAAALWDIGLVATHRSVDVGHGHLHTTSSVRDFWSVIHPGFQ